MKILTHWLRSFLPTLSLSLVTDRRLADDLTLRGIAVEGVHPVQDGHLFEMDITTNRVDAMNHYGIAREAATIYELPLAPLRVQLPAPVPAAAFPVRISPAAAGRCGRFTARVLRDVAIRPSTGRVAEYFAVLGQRPISNAVDASNFVLLSMGQPTHTFDLDRIVGGIVVRYANFGEQLKLLDGSIRVLVEDDLVVADEVKALALAGVMGGWDSMISSETRNILIEAAWFDPAGIRRSARRHGLHTDASHRFERGSDFNAPRIANDLVAELILGQGLQTCGYLEGDLIDLIDSAVQARTANRAPIDISVDEVRRHLGKTLPGGSITSEVVEQILKSLGCTLTPLPGAEQRFRVQLPSWRLDLEREVDLIEEVARVYGFNRFANTLPVPLPVIVHPLAARERAVRQHLFALGFSESISSTFIGHEDASIFFRTPGTSVPVAMENPLSADATLLRPTLVPGLLEMLSHNLNRDVREVRLFEQGQTFTGSADAVEERQSLTVGLTGTSPQTPLHPPSDAPFFELKGAIESILSLFASRVGDPGPGAGSGTTFSAEGAPPWLEPGRAAVVRVDGARIAVFGELSRAEAARRKLRQPIYLAEIDLGRLYELPLRHAVARDLSRFQAVERDFSFTFQDSVRWGTIEAALRAKVNIDELRSLKPVEVFRDRKGISVPTGHYALLIRTVFQSDDRTLSEDELAEWWTLIISTLTGLGGAIRAPEEAAHR